MKKSVLLWAALAASAFGGPIFTVVDLGGPFSYPRAMNASGQIVGTYQTAAGEFRAFLYTPGAGMVSLETPGSSGASGVSINDIGQVIGAFYGVGGRHIFLDIPGVGMSEWAVFSPDQASVSGMNNSGQIVGDVSDSMFMPHAFVFSEDTGVFVLPTLGGLYSSAWAINNAGQIVGWSNRMLKKSRTLVTY